jgi:hypothetical protein
LAIAFTHRNRAGALVNLAPTDVYITVAFRVGVVSSPGPRFFDPALIIGIRAPNLLLYGNHVRSK